MFTWTSGTYMRCIRNNLYKETLPIEFVSFEELFDWAFTLNESLLTWTSGFDFVWTCIRGFRIRLRTKVCSHERPVSISSQPVYGKWLREMCFGFGFEYLSKVFFGTLLAMNLHFEQFESHFKKTWLLHFRILAFPRNSADMNSDFDFLYINSKRCWYELGLFIA